jgi:hypothetical protein
MGLWKNMKEPISLEEYAEEGSAQPPSVSLDGNPSGLQFREGGLLDIGDRQSSAASQDVTGAGRVPESSPEASGAGIGQAGNSTAMRTKIKRGGIAGGGKSGDATSPASRAGRNLTGGARVGALKPITGTPSVGGSIGRAIPFLGTGLMLYDFWRLSQAPNSQPAEDRDRIY